MQLAAEPARPMVPDIQKRRVRRHEDNLSGVGPFAIGLLIFLVALRNLREASHKQHKLESAPLLFAIDTGSAARLGSCVNGEAL